MINSSHCLVRPSVRLSTAAAAIVSGNARTGAGQLLESIIMRSDENTARVAKSSSRAVAAVHFLAAKNRA